LLARHCTEAGLIEKGALLWGKAGQRSLERSAFAEAMEQLRRALDQIATLPATPALRREQVNLQIVLINSLQHVKGFGTETTAAIERANLLIEQALALGESPEDPLLLFLVRYNLWLANLFAAKCDLCRELAERTLAFAEKQKALVPRVIGHYMMAVTMNVIGAPAQSRKHCDQALALYDPVEHGSLAMRFGLDFRAVTLLVRAAALQSLGCLDSALADAADALSSARATGHALTLLIALSDLANYFYIFSGNYTAANAALDEVRALADEKGASAWKTAEIVGRGRLMALTGKPSEAIRLLTGVTDAAQRSTGTTLNHSFNMFCLAHAHAELGQFDEAWRCIGEAITTMEKTKQKGWEPEVYRTAGEVALKSPEPDPAKAETYFERAITVARDQQSKSWELRAAMSLARLWRDQGKRDEARELLAPAYAWFTEGFDTLDLKEAKALLDTLAQ
jgi:tetratricopeptide (TPR) repeat protein